MIVFTQPKVRTQITKSRIQMNHASGFRRSARLGVDDALNVLPEDMVVYRFVFLALLGEISVRVALSLRGPAADAPYCVRQSGDIVAASTGVQRSSRLLSMRGAHALACLPERGRARLVAPGATSSLPAGTTVPGLLIAAPPPLVAVKLRSSAGEEIAASILPVAG